MAQRQDDMAWQAAFQKLESLPREDNWKTVAARVLTTRTDDFRAAFTVAPEARACFMLDDLVEGGAHV